MRKLILTADDYGLNKGVNDAVIQSVRNKTVTSVQVLVNMTSDDDIRKLAKAIHESGDNCGIGLHLCSTIGESVLNRQTTFTARNKHTGKYEFIPLQNWIHNDVDDKDMKDEMEAQFERLAGFISYERIDSISSHQNIHLFYKPYMERVRDLAARGGVPVRSPVRWEQDKNKRYRGEGVISPIEEEAVRTFLSCKKPTRKLLGSGSSDEKMDDRRNIIMGNPLTGKCPEAMCGHWYGQPSMEAITWMVSQLGDMIEDKSNYTTELLMHLSMSDHGDTIGQNYSMAHRMAEYTNLNSVQMKEYIHTLHSTGIIHLGSYRKVLHGTDVSYSDFVSGL